MIGMSPDWLARITTARHAPAIGVGLLALAATVPLLYLRPAAAAIAITAANVLAFATSGEPTVAGMAAQLIAVYQRVKGTPKEAEMRRLFPERFKILDTL